MVIKLDNCNNIIHGEIMITENKLNILFGRNGTGKSTIARAIYFTSRGETLKELAPYGSINDEIQPSIQGVPESSIAIFDDNYVSQYVYQPDSLIKDTFEVLIRSQEYDDTKMIIDNALAKIRTTITENPELITLQQQIGVLINNIEFAGGTNKLAKRKSGIKGILSGKGAYFNPPAELDALKPFFEDDTVSKWAAWRLDGFNLFGAKGKCPYCSSDDSDKTKTINKIFVESFDKASIEYVSAISKTIEALSEYLNMDKAKELISLFGVKENIPVLEAQLAKFGAEARYLHDRLTAIVSFNSLTVDRDGIADLESKLTNMRVDLRACDSYFTSIVTKKAMDEINEELDALLTKVCVLKGEIGKQNKYIQEKINNRKQDINAFLNLAGFKYSFDVEVDGENSARALLKFVLPDGEPGDVQTPGKHLSWGEKHSFALILFMFDAIRSNASLIILDDPISSFDSNKKYAIINRIFKTGEKGNSLYERTVLMLTHDFEPVIDYVQTNSGRQKPTSVCAAYFENIGGTLSCTPIKKDDDMMSSVVLLKELAMDCSLDVAARIGCLRKYLEHQYRNPCEASNAYNILSSLIHRRTAPTSDQAGNSKLSFEEIAEGTSEIKKIIPDFDYTALLYQLSDKELLNRCASEESAYIKMLILRAYIEANTAARERLKRINDVLRKYVDETYHIENDYLYSLDVRRFNIVPENYIADADTFIKEELAALIGE